MTSYQTVPYPGLPIAQSHPDRLATMGKLFGVEVTPIQRARVLEIGCCDGGNLLSIAASLPDSELVGIDLTGPAIERARQSAAERQVSNVQFHEMDLACLPGSLGQFDYIIAHGVYSWVPAATREALMAVVKRSLSANGVAYVSYNAMPGCNFRLMLREMMLFHIRDIADPKERIARARQFLEFFAASNDRPKLNALLLRQIQLLLSCEDYALFHDELEENYHPVYFHEFAAHAARNGLQYLSEIGYFEMRPEMLGSAAAPLFAKAMAVFKTDRISQQQYLDFSLCRHFHRTLLCHDRVPLLRVMEPARLKEFWFRALSPSHRSEEGGEVFEGFQNSQIKTGDPDVCRIMHRLIAAWPRAVPFEDLSGGNLLEILYFLLTIGIVDIASSPLSWQVS